MKKIIFVLLFALALPSAIADICDIAFDMGVQIDESVPKLLPYHNERIAVYDMDDSEEGHVITEDGVITSTSCEIIDEPTYKVFIDGEDTMQELADAEDRLKKFNSLVSEDRIIIEGQTFGRSVKSGLTLTALKVVSWFR